MFRTLNCRFALILVLISTSVTANALGQAPIDSPNILLMMADDMGIGDTSAYQDWTGNDDTVQVKTPAMEELASLGIRFTDAHSPSSRCTATRQALLTGRYTWRTRLKYSVIWGPQGAPLIEPGRPTIATLLQDSGYNTGMTGKWHCGLTYRNAQGTSEPDYEEVDLTQGIADGPLNHGFNFFHGTSRSHPTSKAQGWLYGSRIPAATGGLKVDASQYILKETGPKNYEMAMEFLSRHFSSHIEREKPFFLYYACHSNHTTHNPCVQIADRKVRGQSHPGGKRSDFIYENDVALSLLMNYLKQTDDPRRVGSKLIENTLIIFTSDNGAENKRKSATGPIRSNKGSVYEGGHRVPFIAAWKLGGIGNFDSKTPGATSEFPISHVDIFATLAELTRTELPKDAAEDTFSILTAMKGRTSEARPPIIHHDHSEGAKAAGKKNKDPEAAWLAIRIDNPVVDDQVISGQWKLMVDHGLLINGTANPKELYDLKSDLLEEHNRIDEPELKSLVVSLTKQIQEIHDNGRIRE